MIKRNIVLTGANGFIGRSLVKHLHEKENIVRLEHKLSFNEIRVIFSQLKVIDCFFILGWGGVSGNERGSIDVQLSNIIHIKNILDIIRDCKVLVKKIVFASSVAEFEFIKSICKDSKLPPISLYGGSKLYAHLILRDYCEKSNIKYCFTFISSVYGPGEISDKFICSNLKKLIFTNDILEFSSSVQLFDFVYIDDVVSDLLFILNNDNILGNYLIGSGCYKPLKLFIEQMAAVFDKNNDHFLKFGCKNAGESLDLSEFKWFSIDFISNKYHLERTPFEKGILLTSKFLMDYYNKK